MAIVAVLVSIIVPVTARAKHAALVASAKSQLHQQYLALEQYRIDYDGADYGTATQMGFPPYGLAINNAIPPPIRLSPCGPPIGEEGVFYNDYYYLFYIDPGVQTYTWEDLMKDDGNNAVMIADAECDDKTLNPGDIHVMHFGLGVRLNGAVASRYGYGVVGTPEYWK